MAHAAVHTFPTLSPADGPSATSQASRASNALSDGGGPGSAVFESESQLPALNPQKPESSGRAAGSAASTNPKPPGWQKAWASVKSVRLLSGSFSQEAAPAVSAPMPSAVNGTIACFPNNRNSPEHKSLLGQIVTIGREAWLTAASCCRAFKGNPDENHVSRLMPSFPVIESQAPSGPSPC